MGTHKRMRVDNTNVVVLTQMGLEVPEEEYDNFRECLQRDGYVDVTTPVMNKANQVRVAHLRIFNAEGRD